jgi:hypothetical protein
LEKMRSIAPRVITLETNVEGSIGITVIAIFFVFPFWASALFSMQAEVDDTDEWSLLLVETVVYHLDVYTLLVLECCSVSLRDRIRAHSVWKQNYTDRDSIMLKYFSLHPFWAGAVKRSDIDFKTPGGINYTSAVSADELVIYCDSREPAFLQKITTVEVGLELFLVINLKTKEQRKISVPGISEIEKEYGPISSVRHDPPNFRYLCFRHYGSSGQYETIVECTTGLLAPKVEFKFLGRLIMDPRKMNFHTGVYFCSDSAGNHYAVGKGEECCIFDLRTMELVNNMTVSSSVHVSPVGHELAFSTYGPGVTLHSIPGLEQTRSVPDGSYISRQSKTEFDGQLFTLSSRSGLLANISTGETLCKIPGINESDMYSPTLLGVDSKYVMWCRWPSGDVMMMNIETKETRCVFECKWADKEHYDILFTGSWIAWRNINRPTYHIASSK